MLYNKTSGWLGRAMVLGSFQCLGILPVWHMVKQGPAVTRFDSLRLLHAVQ